MRAAVSNPKRQRGITLLEALVTFVALSLGILSVAQVHARLQLHADIARQRSEAVRLAQQDLEAMRSFGVIAPAPGARSYSAITDGSATIDAESGHAGPTQYRLTRRIDAAAMPHAKTASVSLAWTDRSGSVQQVGLDTIIAAAHPALSAALSLAPTGRPIKGAFGRSASIPLAALDLRNGSSAFKPVEAGTVAYLLDNASGLVSGRCTVAATTMTQQLNASELRDCDAITGYLLSGVIRFSASVPPDAEQANDVPLAVGVRLELSGAPYPRPPACSSEAMKTVSFETGGATRVTAVPIDATAASLGLAQWSDRGERYVAYHCVVTPLASGQWSGRSLLLPSGWSIGTGAAEHRVCRYAADLAGNGDANAAHPAIYAGVSGTLANQNFLVVRGSEDCPSGHGPALPGDSAFADRGTLQHQP